MPFVVDRLRDTDLEAGLRLSTQAGWNQVAADWRRVFDLCPDGFLAGRLDGKVVATGSVAAIGDRIRWIGLILVDEACRGQGFGSIMMDRCLEIARGGDRIVGLDASDFGRPIYLKKGFVDVAPIDRWSGVLRAAGDPRDVEIAGSESFDAIAELDRQACGVDRSPLLRNLLSDPQAMCFVSRGLRLNGFAFLLPGRVTPHLGPVVAKDGAICADLLALASNRLGSSPVIVDALRTPEVSYLWEKSGLTIQRKLTRMTLDKPHPVLWGPLARAVVSFTWG